MPSPYLEKLSPLGRLAVELDDHLSELTRLSGQLERLDIESESGLEHAVKLLNQFVESGRNVSEGMQSFAKAIQEARDRSEAAAQSVSQRARSIYERKQKQGQMREGLNRVKDRVQAANERLVGLRQTGKNDFTDEEKSQMRAGLERINQELKALLAEVQTIKEGAGESGFKSVEHDAKNLLDVLRSASRKIDQMMHPGSD